MLMFMAQRSLWGESVPDKKVPSSGFPAAEQDLPSVFCPLLASARIVGGVRGFRVTTFLAQQSGRFYSFYAVLSLASAPSINAKAATFRD